MNPWLRREYIYQVAIVFLLVSTACLLVFLIPPGLHKQQQLRALQAHVKADGKGRNGYEIYQKWKEEKERKANYVRDLENSIMYEDELYLLMEHWQRESRSSGVKLMRYIPGSQSNEKEYLYQKMQVVLQGNYPSLLQFLQQITRTTSYRSVGFTFIRITEGLQCTLDIEVLMKVGKRNGKRTQVAKTE